MQEDLASWLHVRNGHQIWTHQVLSLKNIVLHGFPWILFQQHASHLSKWEKCIVATCCFKGGKIVLPENIWQKGKCQVQCTSESPENFWNLCLWWVQVHLLSVDVMGQHDNQFWHLQTKCCLFYVEGEKRWLRIFCLLFQRNFSSAGMSHNKHCHFHGNILFPLWLGLCTSGAARVFGKPWFEPEFTWLAIVTMKGMIFLLFSTMCICFAVTMGSGWVALSRQWVCRRNVHRWKIQNVPWDIWTKW